MKRVLKPARIIDARWTPRVNMLTVRYACGRRFEHRADRWRAWYPGYGLRMHLREIRREDPTL